jgi:hypothetical protein
MTDSAYHRSTARLAQKGIIVRSRTLASSASLSGTSAAIHCSTRASPITCLARLWKAASKSRAFEELFSVRRLLLMGRRESFQRRTAPPQVQ